MAPAPLCKGADLPAWLLSAGMPCPGGDGPAGLRPPLPRTNMGAVGLIEMPSARMAPDGELSMGASYFQSNQRYNLGFQILPWLEGSFRYSGVQHFNASYPVYWDR